DTTAFNSAMTINGTGSLDVRMNYGRTLTYSKVITDNGAGFTKSGGGNLILQTATSAVTGPINVNGGVLTLFTATNPIPGAPVNVAAGAQLQFNGVGGTAATFNNNVTLNGLSQGGALAGAV